MEDIFILRALDWNDVYEDNPSYKYDAKNTNMSEKLFADSINKGAYVTYCMFHDFNSTDNGGAIYCQNENFLIEACTFVSVTTSAKLGGAVYFKNIEYGNCYFKKVCGFSCFTTYADCSTGQFSYTEVKDAPDAKNCIELSSIAFCSPPAADAQGTIWLVYGNNTVKMTNMTQNVCYKMSALKTWQSGPDGTKSNITFSSFFNNTSHGNRLFWLDQKPVNYIIDKCNVIKNSASRVIFYVYGFLTLENSCALNNSAKYFYEPCFDTTEALIRNCTIDNTTSPGTFTFEENKGTSFVISLSLISTSRCDSIDIEKTIERKNIYTKFHFFMMYISFICLLI